MCIREKVDLNRGNIDLSRIFYENKLTLLRRFGILLGKYEKIANKC